MSVTWQRAHDSGRCNVVSCDYYPIDAECMFIDHEVILVDLGVSMVKVCSRHANELAGKLRLALKERP